MKTLHKVLQYIKKLKIIILIVSFLYSWNSIAKDIQNSIFEIKIGKFLGSGVFIKHNKKKYLLTNYHVCMMDIGFEQRKNQFIEIKNYYSGVGVSFEKSINSFVTDEYNDICLILTENMFDFLKIDYLNLRRKKFNVNERFKLLTPNKKDQIVNNVKILGPDTKDKNFVFPKDYGHIIDFNIEHGMSGSPLLDSSQNIALLAWGSRIEDGMSQGLAVEAVSIIKLLENK